VSNSQEKSTVVRLWAAVISCLLVATTLVSVGASSASSAEAVVANVPVAGSRTATNSATVATAVGATAALSGSAFKPGQIISNYLFYHRTAMTQAEIQAFLNAKIGTCSNTNCLNVVRTTTFNRAADRTVCGAYTGAANELASTIIFKVQQACGISAKVLLVTLQKEQGLVTAKAPTASKLKIAMGYGCPDTADCNAAFFGLYNQLYKAAWQFKRYSTPDQWGGIQPGTENIQYHPNAACSTKRVVVTNNATAALYNYTPYTPNAAALANLSGLGNSCSSYGNRNFWVYYTSWFGSTLAGIGDEVITRAYTAAGGATGALGAQVAETTCGPAVTCVKEYAHGVIYWASATGSRVVSGAIGDYFLANGGTRGVLGIPTAASTSQTASGGGKMQGFRNAVVLSSAAGTFAVSGVLRTAYGKVGTFAGELGWPAGEASCLLPGGGCSQSFQNGALYSSTKYGAWAVAGAIHDYYVLQTPSVLGYPRAAKVNSSANGGGTVQGFSGAVVETSVSGTFAVKGPILSAHRAVGSVAGSAGWPTSEQTCVGEGTAAVCSQEFQFATISLRAGRTTVTAASGPLVDSTTDDGAIAAYYAASGGSTGPLGAPTGEVSCGLPGDGCSQTFQNGSIYSSGTYGAWSVAGAILDYYLLKTPSVVGYPRAAKVDSPANGGGTVQGFSGAVVETSAAGTFAVKGPILAAHRGVGSVAGRAGWPTSEQKCTGTGTAQVCSQQFQFATISLTSRGTTVTPK
jgi:uncharacterized protein with LGFP repeats